MAKFEDDDPWLEWRKGVGDALIAAQGFAFANRAILHDVITELARSRPDHHAFLAEMFERIGARSVRAPLDDEDIPAIAFEREMVAQFFSNVERDIASTPRPDGA